MNTIWNKIRLALRLAMGEVEVWIGQVNDDGSVQGDRVPLANALSSHFNRGMRSEFRFRARSDSGTVFWWSFSDVTDEMKVAVEKWLAARGLSVRQHAGNTQQIRVGGETILGMTFSHGSGPRSRWRMRVDVV